LLDCAADWTATGRLGAVDDALRILNQAYAGQLQEGLVHFADQAAAGHGHYDVLRSTPTELLGDLKADRLGALSVKRPQIDVHKPPTVLEGYLCAQSIYLIVGAGDADDV